MPRAFEVVRDEIDVVFISRNAEDDANLAGMFENVLETARRTASVCASSTSVAIASTPTAALPSVERVGGLVRCARLLLAPE